MIDADEIQKMGANARALGRSVFDNPFYQAECMPAATGESINVWNGKAEAWNAGWRIEDAMKVGA